MSCTNIILNEYPKLTKYLHHKVGNDVLRYTELVAAIGSKEFKTIIEQENIDIRTSPKKAYEALEKAVALITKDIDKIRQLETAKRQGYFLSENAKIQALDYLSTNVYTIYYSYAMNNVRPTFKEVYAKLRNTFKINVLNLIKSKDDKYKSLNSKDADIVLKMKEAVKEINEDKLTNLFAAFESLHDTEFIQDLLNRKNVASVFNAKDALNEFVEDSENGNFEEDNIIEEESDETDQSTLGWVNNIGEKTNFAQHVEELVKIQLSTIPILNSVEPIKYVDGKPVWNINRENELGLPMYMDAQEIMSILFTETDKTNVANFVNSILTIASKYKGFEGLAYLHNMLANNSDLANKYKMVFSMPVIKKKAVYVNNDGNTDFRETNENINGNVIVTNLIARNIKNATKENIDILKNVIKDKNNKFLFDKIYAGIKNVIPDFDYNELKTFYDKDNNKDILWNFLNDVAKIGDEVITNKEKYKSAIQNNEDVSNFKILPDNRYSVLATFAAKYRPFTKVKISLNGKNVLGKQASFVINNSYLTNFNSILNSESAMESYAAQKFAGTDYNYSNILIERFNNGIFIPGLFRKVGNKYIPTEYANELVEVALFDGASNVSNNKASDYKGLSEGDYLLTALMAYGKKKDVKIDFGNKTITVQKADYFLSIPSDAPKNFVVSMPAYSIDNLYIKPDIELATNEANNKWNSINKVEIKDFEVVSRTVPFEAIYRLVNGTKLSIKISDNFYKPANGYPRFFVNDAFGTKYELTGDLKSTNEGVVLSNARLVGLVSDGKVKLNNINATKSEFIKYYIAKADQQGKLRTVLNHNHPIVANLRNIIKQEVLDAYNEIRRVFKVDDYNNIDLSTGEPVYIDGFNPNSIYGAYGKDKKGNIYKKVDGKVVMLGNVYKMSELNSDNAILNKYYNLLGNDKVFDLIYGNGETKVNVVNGKLILSNTQEQAIDEAIEEFVNSYLTYATSAVKNKYSSFIEGFNDNFIKEYLINRFINGINMDALFSGKSKYYKNEQAVLKRLKEIQAGGHNFGNTDLNTNSISYSNATDNKPIIINGKNVLDSKGRPILTHSTFTGVTVNNTIKHSEKETIDRLNKMLDRANLPDNVKERILAPFGYIKKNNETGDPTITNDAQSYITLEEWIKRITAAGELNKYASLVEALTNDTPAEEIDWTQFSNKVQIQKNFYYDLHREDANSPEVPRQIKNAEFVLIPKFIKGTGLEQVYNAMIEHGIDQINTTETSKAAEHKIITLWDNNDAIQLDDFNANAEYAKQNYSYNYLYRQQEVPEHMVNAENKAGIQILKKMLDNLPNDGKTGELKRQFFNYYVANIKQSFIDLCTEINLPLDSNGNLIVEPNGTIKEFNISVFLQKAKEQAARQNANRVILEMFDSAIEDFSRYPLFTNNIGTKIENIVNSLFNKAITRQTIEGWHAAQLSDFGFNKLEKDEVGTDSKLQYKQVGEYDGMLVYYIEIRARRWSNALYKEIKDDKGKVIKRIPIDINNVPDSARTMIGYRIPTEGKQSIAVMKVVEFLDDGYGSTVVVPDEWVTQTGSDFDVDSIYAMTKHLYQDKNGNIKENSVDDYTRDKKGYIKYVNAHIDRAARKLLGDYKGKINNTIEQIKNNRKALKEELNEQYKDAIIQSLNNTYDTKNNLWQKGKENKDKELIAIAKAIGNKNKTTKSFDYINEVIANLNELINNGTIKNQTNILNAVYDQYKGLRDLFIQQKEDLSSVYENAKDNIKQYVQDAFDEQFNKAEEFAIKYNLKNYNDWIQSPVEEGVDYNVRNNVIVQTFIDILNNPAAFEENTGRSHFETLAAENDKWAEIAKSKVVSEDSNLGNKGSHDFLTQLEWKESAGSGIKLKAISVNLDTMASIGNVTHAKLNFNIPVRYDNIDKKNAEAAYGKNYDAKNNIVKHNMLGWSYNNKNIDNELLTPYSSQTTAHILDVMKAGAVHNENIYTFNAFKLLANVGINYDTAVSFMYQPVMDRLVNYWKLTQSFISNDNRSPLYSAIEEVASSLRIDTSNKSMKEIIDNFYKYYGDFVEKKYGDRTNPYLYSEYNRQRLAGELNEEESRIHDMVVLIQFDNINKQANIVNSTLRVLTSDKFGAKQTFFQTDNIFRDIKDLLNEKVNMLYVETADGEMINLIEAIYPDIRSGNIANMDLNQSAYSSLAAMLKFASYTSTVVDSNIFETDAVNFNNIVRNLDKFVPNGRLKEEEYKAYKEYLVHKAYIGNEAVPTLVMPIIVTNNNELAISTPSTGVDQKLVKDNEILRIAGINNIPNAELKFEVKDVTNPTDTEVDEYIKLTPAQKVLWIKKNLTNIGIFNYIEINDFNENTINTHGYATKTLKVNKGDLTDNALFDLFDRVYISNNKLLKLAAIDLVKYAYVVEGNKFKYGNVSKIITNLPLRPIIEGGMGIGYNSKAAVLSYNNIDADSVASNELAVGFIRQNYDSFRLPYFNYEFAKEKNIAFKTKLSFETNGDIIIYEDDYEFIKHKLLKPNGDPYNVIRIKRGNKNLLYYGHINNYLTIYSPINRLSTFDADKTIENSRYGLNNIFNSLEDFIYDEYNEKLHNAYISANSIYNLDNAPEIKIGIDNKFNIAKQIDETNWKKTPQIIIPNADFAEDVSTIINEYNDKKYSAIRMNDKFIEQIKSMGVNSIYADYYNKLIKYPNRDTSKDFVIMPKVKEGDKVRYSILEDKDPLSCAIKQAAVKIRKDSFNNNKSAEAVIKSLHTANINYLNTKAIKDNTAVATSTIARYIKATADKFINETEQFMVINGENIAVNDKRAIDAAIKDKDIAEKFQNLANLMASFKERYKLFMNIDTDSLNDEDKEAVLTIQKAVNNVSNNTKIVKAKRDYWNAFIKEHSTNPNVVEDLQSAFDIYGDTSKPDYWIQDIKFNRNPIIQAVVAETQTIVQEARINGKKEAIQFEKEFNKIKEEAAKTGLSINLNKMIDENGKFIQPESKEWRDKVDELHNKYLKAVTDTKDVNSVEALRAKWMYNKFIYNTTKHRYKVITYTDVDGNDKSIDYDNNMLNLEYNMLFNKNNTEAVAKTYSEYKKLLNQQKEILSNVIGGVLNEEQEEQMHDVYIKINNLKRAVNDYDDSGNDNAYAADALDSYIKAVSSLKQLFFDRKVKDGFYEQLKRNLAIIEKLEIRDPNGNLIKPMSELMMNEDYKKAKQWIKYNAIYTIDKDLNDEINSAYEVLSDPNKKGSVFRKAVIDANARDEYGIIDGNKFTKEQVAAIKEETLKNFTISKASGDPYAGIIRSHEQPTVLYTKEFHNHLIGHKPVSETIAIEERINHILQKAFDNENRVLHTASDKLTLDDLRELKRLIDFYNLAKEGKGSKDVALFIKDNCIIDYNWKAYNSDKNELIARGNEFKTLWHEVFEEVNDEGNIVPNSIFYGLIKPKDESLWIDKTRTHAMDILNRHTVQTETNYYRATMAEKRATLSNEDFREWYLENHYFDPYTRTYKPLRIWTHTEYVYDNGEKVKGEWQPRINQTDVLVRDNVSNIAEFDADNNDDNYIEGTTNYKLGSKYKDASGKIVNADNEEYLKLNEYERKAIKLIQKYMYKYAFNSSNKYFVKQGYLPTIRQEKGFDGKELLKEAAAFFGFSANMPYDMKWRDDDKITYNNDNELANPMLQNIINKDIKPHREIPHFPNEGESESDFIARRQEAIDYNKKAKEENDKIRSQFINKDWINVIKTFIETSAKQDASRVIKNILYLADDALLNAEAYKLNYKNELMVDRALSSDEEIEYKTVSNEYSSKALRNYIRRIVFNQYKEINHPKLLKLGNIAQNVAGTKYMMLNVTGGIANILTGQSNIGMERLAREYFNEKDYLVGQNLYFQGTASYIANMYSDKSTTLQDAVIKLANVVDYDRIEELTDKNLRGKLRDLRGLLFSPQAMGEHFMQNSVLFTMMKNHKIITDENNNAVIISKEMYLRDADKEALFEVINDDLKAEYYKMIDEIKKDKALKAKYNMFRRNIVHDFVRQYLTKEQIMEYIAAKKRIRKEKAAEFNKLPTDVYSQFVLEDGYATLKGDAIITYKDFAEFVNKVIAVNKHIHGVYDKLGSALIENKWWGGMVMQFHKHLYPGFKKRYRNKYYYDEQLENIQGAAYTSLFRFLATPFDKTINDKEQLTTLNAIKSYINDTINFLFNIKLNYALLPENEQANIRRNLADLIYVGAAINAAILLTAAAGGDDEIEESILYNLGIYTADRLASEAFAFNPIGLASEAKKLWSSPVAFFKSGDDLLKSLGFGIQTLVDGGFDAEYKTGRYAGENKLKVIVERNIPVWRNINRIQTLPENNSYYKLGENAISFIPIRSIAHTINPDVDVD